MTTRESYVRNDLVRDTERLLLDLGPLGDEGGFPPATDGLVKELVQKEEMRVVEASGEASVDGYAEITLSDDGLSAGCTFHPASNGMRRLEPADVESQLEAMGIRHGVDQEAIREAVFACDAGGAPIFDVVVASATRPVKEVMPYLVVEPGLLDKPEPDRSANARVDYREISPFTMVKKGEALAHIVPKRAGALGYDLAGAAMPYGKERVAYPKPGKNTVGDGGIVRAACDGRLMIDELIMWVNEVLSVRGNVDYSTGNIEFPGDIDINGEVKTGFKVRSGGSIYCANTIDATEVEAAGDVVAGLGIVGRHSGRVKAGGSVQAKFIENCLVEAAGSVMIQSGCLNSVVQTLGQLYSGPRGIISGGKISAAGGINVAQLGTAAGAKTEIICGIDYTIQQKLVWVRDKNIALAMKLGEIDGRAAEEPGAASELSALRGKVKASIHRLNEIALSLVGSLDKNDKAEVLVRGNAYPGTYIEICHVSFVVTKVLTRQRLYLDKALGRVVSETIAH